MGRGDGDADGEGQEDDDTYGQMKITADGKADEEQRNEEAQQQQRDDHRRTETVEPQHMSNALLADVLAHHSPKER